MQFETREFFDLAIQDHGLKPDLEFYADNPPGPHHVSFPIPSEHSRILWFAKQLLTAVAPGGDILVLPTEWGVWPSSENWHLYNTLRVACGGGDQPLKDAPCHRFSADERELALDFIYLFLLFSWDFYIFAYHEDDLLFLSHDGFAVYHSPKRLDAISAIADNLQPLEDETEPARKFQS